MSYFGKLWAMIRGFFIRAGDDVVSSSPQAIQATYASAIDDAKRRYKDMEKAVAMLVSQREKTEMNLTDLDREDADLQKRLEGALVSAEAEPNNEVHREAGARYLTRIKEIGEAQARLTHELEAQGKRVEEYKTKLRSFTEEIQRLKKEQGEMIAEFISTQQVLALEDRLRGLGETAVDESIVAIREKVANMRAQMKIAAEMRGATTQGHDETYERIGAEKEAKARFDQLLETRAASKAVTDKERDLG
ncbi:MAG TPA: PspA/IM30 family protein [Desulfomonilaceae bacterium]|nr:PspA/IM30 family protein [Desulfomonilaceae bacterium]